MLTTRSIVRSLYIGDNLLTPKFNPDSLCGSVKNIKKLSTYKLSCQAFWSQTKIGLYPFTITNMVLELKRAEMEDHLPPPQAKRPCLGELDQEVSRIVARNPSTVKFLLNVCYPVQARVLSFLDRTDFRNMQLAGLGLGISRIMQRLYLIPIPCSNSKQIRLQTGGQNTGLDFLTRVGWLPETTCDNTTATMDEIRPCTGMVWFSKFSPGTTDNIDICREPHLDITGREVTGSSHNTCLECFLSAERRMSLLERRRIRRLRRTLCSKHTKENTRQAQNKPCKCLGILSTEWRCWPCRRSTLRGLSGIAMMRKEALDEGRYDNGDDKNDNEDGDGNEGQDDKADEEGQDDEDDQDGDDGQDSSSDEDDGERSDGNDSDDRDMRDDRIPKDCPHFCPMSGCNEQVTTQQEQEASKRRGRGVMKMCLACQTILLPPSEEEEEVGEEDDDDGEDNYDDDDDDDAAAAAYDNGEQQNQNLRRMSS